MRVSVLGVGSIGSIIASSLATTTAEVHLHVRGERGAQQMLEGLGIEGHRTLNFEPHRFLYSCEELPHEPELNQGSDLVILACKSYDVPHLAQQATAFLKPNGVAFALSNGWAMSRSFLVSSVPSAYWLPAPLTGRLLNPNDPPFGRVMGQ